MILITLITFDEIYELDNFGDFLNLKYIEDLDDLYDLDHDNLNNLDDYYYIDYLNELDDLGDVN